MKEQQDPQTPQARSEELVVQELSDEVLVYDLKRNKAHCLNQTAALVWKHCNGENTIADIAALLEQQISQPVDETMIWLAVGQLGKANLLEKRLAASLPSPMLSRREAVRRLGLGSAIAVPLVMSIIAPNAYAAATCLDLKMNDPCTEAECGQLCASCMASFCTRTAPNVFSCQMSAPVCPP